MHPSWNHLQPGATNARMQESCVCGQTGWFLQCDFDRRTLVPLQSTQWSLSLVMWSRRYEKLCNVRNLLLTSSAGFNQGEKGQLWRLTQSCLIICAKNERYICYDAFKFIRRLHQCLFTMHCCTRQEQTVFRKNCACFWNMKFLIAFF